MANMTLRTLFNMIGRLLHDEDFDDWTESELMDWYNLAARDVVVGAPDANAVIESVRLVSGVKQSLPSGVLEFIRPIRNMGTDGETTGEAITMTTLPMLEVWDRDWTTATATTAIKHAMKEQFNWYCYPPSDGTGYVEIEVSKVPTQVSWDEDGDWESELVGIEDKYIDPLIQKILFYTYSKDTDFPGAEQRAQKHDGLFRAGIGGQ